ncbi:hypothetical protein GCM10008937_00920 [Deinococcus depolymerans]|uniref:Uncharacterized protein n=1 Tax=Deinococcus depolymerans TaxID=392408 RepID=A0ABN1BH11_9DEIO
MDVIGGRLRRAAPPPSPLPQRGRGSSVALGRYFAEVIGGCGAGPATDGAAYLRLRAVRPARFAHDGLGCGFGCAAGCLGACRQVLLSQLRLKQVCRLPSEGSCQRS